MSRDSGWVQREMRLMSDKQRDAYIIRSRVSWEYTKKLRDIYAKYKPRIAVLQDQRDAELQALQLWRNQIWDEYKL